MRSPEIQLGNWKLHQIMLEDKDLYANFIKETAWPVNLWSGNFPFIWSYNQSSRRNVFWKIIDDLLVTFIFTKKKKLLLLCLPFGRGDVNHLLSVLYQSMQFCYAHNCTRGFYTNIRTVNECQLQYLLTSEKFNQLFAQKKLRGMEKHHSIYKLLDLSGKEFNSIRKSVNKYYRLYPDIKFREYMPSDFEKVLGLNKYWKDTAGTKYKTIIDKDYFNVIIKYYKELDLIALVADCQGDIVGVNIAGILPDGAAWGCICKTRYGIEGLQEAIILKMVHRINEIDPRIQHMNVGSDMGIEGLRRFKEKFKPVLNLERYSIYLRAPTSTF